MYEFELESVHSRIPCYLVADDVSNRFAVRTFDTSGEVFQDLDQLLQWVEQEWHANDFISHDDFYSMLNQLKSSALSE